MNRVVPAAEVVDTASELAEQIAANAPLAVRNSRLMVREANDLTEADGVGAQRGTPTRSHRLARCARGRTSLRREAGPRSGRAPDAPRPDGRDSGRGLRGRCGDVGNSTPMDEQRTRRERRLSIELKYAIIASLVIGLFVVAAGGRRASRV